MTTENKNGHHGGNHAFFWGLVIGAIFATLLTTKKGRQILRDLTDLSLELFEDFVEQKTRESNKKKIDSDDLGFEEAVHEEEEAEKEASEDLASEITEVEETPKDEKAEVGKNGNGHHKKRLFRGIRRK
jgi:hypothetical protein